MRNARRRAFQAAFPYTLPILAGFLFLGMSYGIYMNTSGFPFWYPMLMSTVIFAGSIEFVAVNLLLGTFDPLQALTVTLVLNARHLFYGVSMLEKYRDLGWKRVYLIFGLCDETFSINCSTAPPADVDRGWFYFFVTLLNQSYWVLGATLGGIFGNFLTFNTEGLDFVMTALFAVILIEHLLKSADKTSAVLGLGLGLLALLVFGPDRFMIPAMVLILAALFFLQGKETSI